MYMLLLQLSATNASDASEKTVTLSLMHEIQWHSHIVGKAKQSKAVNEVLKRMAYNRHAVRDMYVCDQVQFKVSEEHQVLNWELVTLSNHTEQRATFVSACVEMAPNGRSHGAARWPHASQWRRRIDTVRWKIAATTTITIKVHHAPETAADADCKHHPRCVDCRPTAMWSIFYRNELGDNNP